MKSTKEVFEIVEQLAKGGKALLIAWEKGYELYKKIKEPSDEGEEEGD